MEENNKKDMGTGSVRKWMVSLAVPALVGQIVNLLYNIVDRIYIGHLPEIGAKALTGVGLFTPILMLITAFALLSGSGGAPRAAIAMGKGDKDTAEKIVANCFTVLLILAAILTAALWFTAPTLLRFFGASSDTLPFAVDYAQIYILGSVFVLIVMGMNSFISTQGFAKFSMLTTVIGAVINIILDPILMFGFGLGVKGAAIATVLSQAISALWILRFLTGKTTILKLKLSNMPLRRKVILPCLALGICQGGQPLISYNYGAGKLSRVKEAFFCQFFVCVGYTVIFWLSLMAFPQIFAGIFTSDAELVGYTAWAIRVFLACGFSVGFQISCQQAFMALGQAKISLIMACLRKLILLIPLIFILPLFFSANADKAMAVFLAEPVSDITAAAVTTVTFFLFFRKLMKNGQK